MSAAFAHPAGSILPESDAPKAAPRTVWGIEPLALHDLLWASRCVQIVRPGSGSGSVERGPALYFLLRSDQLILHPLDEILKRMHWASPRLVRLRVLTRAESNYAEQVVDDGNRVRFSRAYGRSVRRTGFC